jgi:hypothetical protein
MLVAGLSSISCNLVYDFNNYQGLSGGGGLGGGGMGGSAGATGPGTGGSAGGGVGGSGGSVSCVGIDFTQDPQHCGACGFDCAGGACNDGVCEPVATDLALTGRQVASLGERVFVVRGAAPPGELVTYAADFDALDSPLSTEAVCDITGFISAGPMKVYYRAQNPADVCGTDEYVYSCGDTPPCTKTTHNVPVHINGVAAVGSTFYFMTPDGVIHATNLSPTGVPSVMENMPVPVASMAMVAEGAFLLEHDPVRNALWWTTYNGCIYKAPIANFPIATADCFPQTVPSTGRLVISPNDKFYVGSVSAGIYAIDPDASIAGPAPAFGAPALGLVAVDSDYVYAFDTASPSLVALRHGSAVERARIPVPDVIFSADANHPNYVFFVAGSSLYRWRKPSP